MHARPSIIKIQKSSWAVCPNGTITSCCAGARIAPRIGFWTFPAGFMEQGESAEAAAARETLEEAEAEVQITSLHGVFSLPHVSQVYLVFRGLLRRPDFGAGSESLESKLFDPEIIPWDELAFPVIQEALRRYVSDRRQGKFDVHLGTIASRAW